MLRSMSLWTHCLGSANPDFISEAVSWAPVASCRNIGNLIHAVQRLFSLTQGSRPIFRIGHFCPSRVLDKRDHTLMVFGTCRFRS
jgi:hypothetical protein